MELRPPPLSPTQAGAAIPRSWFISGIVVLITGFISIGALVWQRTNPEPSDPPEHLRAIASKLKAAGALDAATILYAAYVNDRRAPRELRARVAYSLGQLHLDAGRGEEALRWFYEAEGLGLEGRSTAVGEKIVHTLEFLGRVHAAEAALSSRVGINVTQSSGAGSKDSDPLVARIGANEIRRSDVTRALDDLPPQLRQQITGDAQYENFLRRYVADELIWRKAQKLEYDEDPEIRRQMAAMLKRLAITRFIDREVVGKVEVSGADLATFHQANRPRYDRPETAKLSIIEFASQAEAAKLRPKCLSDAAFASTARKKSLHAASRSQGGALARWVSRGEAFLGAGDSRSYGEVVFSLDPGSVSKPIGVGSHFFLVRLREKRPAQELPLSDESVQKRVERDYRDMKARAAYQQLIDEQLAASDVEIFAEKMAQPQ